MHLATATQQPANLSYCIRSARRACEVNYAAWPTQQTQTSIQSSPSQAAHPGSARPIQRIQNPPPWRQKHPRIRKTKAENGLVSEPENPAQKRAHSLVQFPRFAHFLLGGVAPSMQGLVWIQLVPSGFSWKLSGQWAQAS